MSEDLDFLLAKTSEDMGAIVGRASKKTQEAFLRTDPLFTIEAKDKTKNEDRMVVYQLFVSHPGYVGKTMVKVEFWKVTPEYLQNYPIELRAPMRPGDMVSKVSAPVPAATLQTAYCDKLTAFATRPFLKWRDIFDLWWIGTQTGAELPIGKVVDQFLHNVSAYTTIDKLPPADALRRFLTTDAEDILHKAQSDLKPWLPPDLWASLNPDGVRAMISYVRQALADVADTLDPPADVLASVASTDSAAVAVTPVVNLKRMKP